MNRVVKRTAIKTVIALIIIVILGGLAFMFACPQRVATFGERTGNYSMASTFAWIRYRYTGDTEDLARCFEDSVLAEKNDKIIEYGEELIAKKNYPALCEKKDEKYATEDGYNYDKWVNSKLSATYYTKNNIEKAILCAFKSNGTDSFAYGNPIMALAARIKADKNKEAATALLSAIENGIVGTVYGKLECKENPDRSYLNAVISNLKNI